MRSFIRRFVDFVFQHSYGMDRITVELYLIKGIEFTIKMSNLRKKLSLWVGKLPKNKKEYKKFWLDVLPDKNIAAVTAAKGVKIKMYYTKKQIIEKLEKIKWSVKRNG